MHRLLRDCGTRSSKDNVRKVLNPGSVRIIAILLRAAIYVVTVTCLCLSGVTLSSESGLYWDHSETTDSTNVINGTFLRAASTVAASTSDADTSAVDSTAAGAGAAVNSSGGKGVTEIVNIEVTEQGRYIIIPDKAGTITVTGAGCVIHVLEGTCAGRVELTESAGGSRVIADGLIDEIEVSCIDARLMGTGRVDTVRLYRAGTRITCKYDSLIDASDRGLSGAKVSISAPGVLAAGETLAAACTIENAVPGKTCNMIWYIDGTEVMSESIVTGAVFPLMTHLYTYERYMEENSVLKVVITYKSVFGELFELSDEVSITLRNYSMEHWTRRDAPQVLEKVTTGYKGNFTLEWAQENDLTDYEKEVWINAKGYSSDSEYLIWVSIAYQRVNIFRGAEKDWELIRSSIVGTGAPGSGTATGVCKTTYKQKDGWTTSKYTVRPVVRFRQGTGYAFHSRLYYPRDTGRLIDSRIGFPVSHGCVRMYDDDIWFIYDNIPDGTTVVIF